MTTSVTITHSGGGPRTAETIKSLAAQMPAFAHVFDAIMEKYGAFTVPLTIFERQPESNGMGGNAFQPNCDATLNVGMPHPHPTVGLETLRREHPDIAKAVDLAESCIDAIRASPRSLIDKHLARNPAAADLLRHATQSDGTINVKRAFGPRGFVGEVDSVTLPKIFTFLQDTFPWLTIKVNYDTAVTNVDLGNRLAPTLSLDGPSGAYEHLTDYLALVNGTTSQVPVKPEIAHKVFSGPPTLEALIPYLERMGCLDEDGTIRPGMKIILAGAGLGTFDGHMLTRALTKLRGARDDPPATIDPPLSKVADYQELLTYLSPTLGKIPAPRHVEDQGWNGIEPLGGSYESAHAAFLSKDRGFLATSQRFLRAATAATLGCLPADLDTKMTTQERAQDFSRQTSEYLAALGEGQDPQTACALLRAGYQAIANGGGFVKNFAAAEKDLAARYPITADGRHGWNIQRALLYEHTLPKIARIEGNTDIVALWRELQYWLTSSPVEIQEVVNQDFINGVAVHAQGIFEQVEDAPGEPGLMLHDGYYDAAICFPFLTPNADAVLAACADQAKSRSGRPDYALGRMLQTDDAKLISASDCGLGGEGVMVTDIHGKKALLGVQWADTNARGSAIDRAPVSALYEIAFMLLAGCKDRDPATTIARAYKQQFPTEEAFNEEALQATPAFHERQQQLLFLDFLDQVAATGADYQRYYASGHTSEQREALLDRLYATHAEAVDAYRAGLKTLVPFLIKTRDEFFDAFVDFRYESLLAAINAILTERGLPLPIA